VLIRARFADTMNLSRGTEMLLDELNFVATADVVKPCVFVLLPSPFS